MGNLEASWRLRDWFPMGTKRHRAGHLAMPSPVVNVTVNLWPCESLRVSGHFQPTTLKQAQRSQDEGQNASKAIRVDLGDG